MKANMGKLVLGIVLMLAGVGIAYLVWNLLIGMEVVYISKRSVGLTQIIPLLASLPGVLVYIIWFFSRKNYVAANQVIDSKASAFAAMFIAAIGLDLALGMGGLVIVGFGRITATIWAYMIAIIMQIITGLCAFMFCTPFARS